MAKNQKFLGVDFGASGIKIVELENEGGRARLSTYGYTEYGGDISVGDDVSANAEIKGAELEKLCVASGVKTKSAIAGLPMSAVFSTLFSFLDSSDKDLEAQIKAKLKNLAPIPEDDMVIDWKRVSPPAEDKMVRVSVTAASKKHINGYVGIFKSAGLEIKSLETEAFAMARSLLGKDKALAMVVDIGSVKSNILIIKDAVPLIHRTVKFGGDNVTSFLAEKLHLGVKEAEGAKKALSEEDGIDGLRDVILPVINEIKYCQGLYSEQYNSENIEKMVLTGGAALMNGISGFLAKESGLRTFIGDPWARVIYPDALRPTLDAIGARFSVAVGLAMRNMI